MLIDSTNVMRGHKSTTSNSRKLGMKYLMFVQLVFLLLALSAVNGKSKKSKDKEDQIVTVTDAMYDE
jgi:hypothetical protein